MGEWTSLRDIMQDLSVAQGCFVPASLETYGASGPPALNIDEEESDEQSYYEAGGGGDFTAPDCELIQQMLNMVKENKDNSEDDSPASTSDLNPLSPEFVPQKLQDKIKRNVALSSIITAKEAELAARRPIPNNVIPVMFKRKSLNTSEVKSDSSSPIQMSSHSSPDKFNQYTPSTRANEYYSKYLAKSKLKEQFEVDIWTRAERQMKEIEARKKREAELESPQENGIENIAPLASFACGYDLVSLPQHRHNLTGKCVVCEVASKYGYEFEEVTATLETL